MNSARGFRLSSRLLHNGKGRPPISAGVQIRSLSSPTSSLQFSRARTTPLRPQALQFKAAFKPFAISRYASTAPNPSPEGSSLPADPAASGISEPVNAWDIPTGFGEASISIEPHIGWLKEVGLDFGWGPTSTVQWLLEHIHVYSGFSWASSIVAATVLIRLLLFPLFLNSADMAGRQAALAPVLKPLQARLDFARRNQDKNAMLSAYMEMKKVNSKAGIKYSTIFYPTLIQTPLGFGSFVLTRRMGELPVPGLDTSGFLWINDLTIGDPTYLLPALSGGLMYLSFKQGGELGGTMPDDQKKMAQMLRYGLPPLAFLFSLWMPAITQVLFTTAAFLAFIQSRLFRSNKWRQRFKIQPLPEGPAQDPNAGVPYKGVINRYQPPTADEKARTTTWGTLKARAEGVMAQKQTQGPRLNKQELSKAESYEQRRRREIEAEIVDKEQQQRRH